MNLALKIKGKNNKHDKLSLIATKSPGEIYAREIFINGNVTPQNIVTIKSARIAFL
ncbi:hypothetical protein JPFTNV_19380 [Francisella tularensis subsp. holarctica]|nr:hypothetical protein JPFTNV_19380 [Francisella tularensis subsp. holarctica]BCL56166.1 hypothetical protein JPFTKU_19800 [Francisella tularensis subsp. holarctica]